jgi:two-component system CheB/CheR fusion protein
MATPADSGSPAAREADERGDRLFVVGIGASAGGLDALRALFSELPPQPDMSFVVVVHLSPDHDSHLAQ